MVKKILVVGDIIVDKYISGTVEKISQEAPTPIVNVNPYKQKKDLLGGAGNVAANIKSLGVDVELISIIGSDVNSLNLKRILKQKKIKFNPIKIKNFYTTEKIRVTSNGQQIIRIDKDSPKIQYNQDLILNKIKKSLHNISLLIISDYNKGTIQNISKIIELANKKKIKVLIDSKNENIRDYRNSFLIKPNQKEFQNIFKLDNNIKNLKNKITKILKKLNIDYLLLTLGSKGMKLFSRNNVTNFTSEAKEVYDVTGAGDTVLASLAVGIHTGKNIIDSVKFSLRAAEIVISKLGTSVIDLNELEKNVDKDKLLTKNHINETILGLKKMNKKIVFTNGCFDLLHSGHIHILKESKKNGDVLIVGLNSDISVKKNKGKERPIINEIDRAAHLDALECVDYISIFDEKTPESLIAKIKPDILTKGEEYKNKLIVGKKTMLENNGKIVLIKKYKNYSTSNLLNKKK
tara:strand:- start:5699 stop:7084 length:1386 start_codon:yes stop_codon:yes gene_type:complete